MQPDGNADDDKKDGGGDEAAPPFAFRRTIAFHSLLYALPPAVMWSPPPKKKRRTLPARTPFQFFLECERKRNAMRKEKTTAAETPALAAESDPVSAPNQLCCAPCMAPRASR